MAIVIEVVRRKPVLHDIEEIKITRHQIRDCKGVMIENVQYELIKENFFAPSDFHLHTHMEKWHASQPFDDDDELQNAMKCTVKMRTNLMKKKFVN